MLLGHPFLFKQASMLRCSLSQGCRLLTTWLARPKWETGPQHADSRAWAVWLFWCMLCCIMSQAADFDGQQPVEHVEQGCLLCCIFQRLQVAAGSPELPIWEQS